MARVSASTREAEQADEFTANLRAYKVIKDEVDSLTKKQKDLRDYLMDTVEQTGFTDESGNLWIELEEDVEGVLGVKRERRVKATLDEEAAERVLAERGLTEECYKTVRVVDEDAVMAALYDGRLSEEDVDTIFPQKVTWALVLAK